MGRHMRANGVCGKCAGDGKIANDEEGTPWSMWANLPSGSNLAVKLGLVAPVTCPRCEGSGYAHSEGG